MKIYVLGTRGIPDVAGGVETHCERLYPRLASMGMDVTVVRRRCYVSPRNEYRGVRLIDVYAPRIKSLEAMCHTLLGVFKAGIDRADVVHLHAVGPSLLAPLARLLGMKVVVTNHGHDYEREKWGRVAKAVLRMGERVGVRFANEVIAISQPIADVLESKYGRGDFTVIPNGVEPACVTEGDDYLKSIGVERGRYVLAVGRLVKEKGLHDLIMAFGKIRTKGFRLVIAGDADHRDDYSDELKAMAVEAGVVMPGYISGEPLQQLMSHSALFVLPSYHEGLPIALLEAMSYGLDVAVSDIRANRLSELDGSDFFKRGDCDDLARLIDTKLRVAPRRHCYDMSRYDWDAIAARTAEVYGHLSR